MIRNHFIKIVLITLCLLACNIIVESPDEVDVTLDTAHNGMITGQVLSSKIVNNQVVFVPWERPNENFYGAHVKLSGTEFETETTLDGFYSFDNIPAGTYTIVANTRSSLGGAPATQSVTVIKQQTVVAPDLKLIMTPYLFGKIYQNDKVTPFSNQLVKLYGGSYPPSNYMRSVTTSNNGSYAFERWVGSEPTYNLFSLKNDAYKILFINENDETMRAWFEYDIIEANAYAVSK